MQNTDPTDALLAIRCQLGEPEAWDDLVHRWHPRLWAFISRMTSDPARAEDVLQTTWLRVVRSMGRLREPERVAAWLYNIARTAVADQFRELYRTPPTEEFVDVSQTGDASEQFTAADAVDAVETGLGQLHPIDREAVVLHYFESLPVADVAEICGVPPGTIKSRLHRARRLMRDALTD